MNYVLTALKISPIVGAISLLVHLATVLPRRKERPGRERLATEFLLILSLVAFVYVTQVIEFGDDLGDRLNLRPLRPLYLAAKYGLVNAGNLGQIALNVAITIPLGMALALVWPKCFGRIRWLLLTGLLISVATEVLQYSTGRHADIDDVIANSAGVAVGSAVITLVGACLHRFSGRGGGSADRPPKSARRMLAATATIFCVVAPFVTVTAINGGNRPGAVYYGHLQPARVNLPASLPSLGGTAQLYRRASDESQETVLARLRGRFGVHMTCGKNGEDRECSDGPATRLIVFPSGAWSVIFNYADTRTIDLSRLPDESSGLAAARTHLAKFGIDVGALRYSGVNSSFNDGLMLDFESREESGRRVFWGKVSVTLGENGRLLGIEDARTSFTLVRSVSVMPPRKAVSIAQDVGVGKIPVTASVESVDASHYFDEASGYLVPTWNVHGAMRNGDGTDIPWTPVIDARQG